MLSLPDDWKFYDTELEKHAKDGKDALKGALKELKTLGYMKRERRRSEEGKFEWETLIFEQPYTDKPCMEKPLVEKPSMDNPQLLSNKELNNKKLNNNKKTYADFVSMTEEEYEKLVKEFGQLGTLDRIENLNLYKGSKGVNYKNDYLTILAWDRRDKEKGGNNSAKPSSSYDNLF